MDVSLRWIDEKHSTQGMLDRTHWSPSQSRVWVPVLFSGLMVLMATRISLPVCLAEMAQDLQWDKRVQGIILSSFFGGYIFTQVIGGHLADRYGGDCIQWIAALVWSLATLSTVFVAHFSITLVFLARFVTGLAQGVHYPSLMSLLSKRVPVTERNLVFGIINAGSAAGTIAAGGLGSGLSGYGWQYMFLITGVVGILWSLLLRTISVHYKHQVHYQLSERRSWSDRMAFVGVSKVPLPQQGIPWKKALRKPAILALLAGHFSCCLFAHTVKSWIATYFHEVFPQQQETWLYNCLPWLFWAISSVAGGWITNKMIAHDVSVTRVRKMVVFISGVLPALFLLLMSAFAQNGGSFSLALFIFIISLIFDGIHSSGTSVNPSDLLPAYAGSLYGAASTFGTIPGICGIALIGYILHATSSWTLVYAIVFFICTAGSLVFVVFGSGMPIVLPSDANTK